MFVTSTLSWSFIAEMAPPPTAETYAEPLLTECVATVMPVSASTSVAAM